MPAILRVKKRSKHVEQDLVKAVLQYLTLQGCLVWRQNQGAVKASYKGKERFVRFCSRPGVSDIIGVSKWGHFMAVECKKPKGRLTPDQESFLADVRIKGGLVCVPHSIDELIEWWENCKNEILDP